jgi:hypothetical protein
MLFYWQCVYFAGAPHVTSHVPERRLERHNSLRTVTPLSSHHDLTVLEIERQEWGALSLYDARSTMDSNG